MSIIVTSKQSPTSVLYLDIDGTVRKGYGELRKFVNHSDDVEVFQCIPEILKIYADSGWRIVGISNQGGVALGYVARIHVIAAMIETYNKCDQLFDKMAVCFHHPDAKDPEYAICWCRKPKIGMIVESALELANTHREYYPPHMALFVGDMDSDRECAERAGIQFIHAKTFRAIPLEKHPLNPNDLRLGVI